MKLLLDENLPIGLLGFVRQRCPGSTHVVEAGLRTASDARIWAFAKKHELAIVTRDFDFVERSAKERGPPRVVWLDLHNPTVPDLRRVFLRILHRLERLFADAESFVAVVRAGAARP